MRPVGKIQPSYIHPQAQQLAYFGFGIRGRTDGANDLGAASHCGRNTVQDKINNNSRIVAGNFG
jgi:hypothetical protein